MRVVDGEVSIPEVKPPPSARLLIVGSGGYLGSTTERIGRDSGWQVSGWRSSRDDASDWLARIASGAFTAIINTAAAKLRVPESLEMPRYWASNVELPYLLGEAARSGHSALIHIGTRWTLGETGEGPNSLYAATKGFGDQLITSAWLTERAGIERPRVAVVRVRDLMGPSDPRPSLPRLLAAASSEGVELPMTMGEQLMDPLDVRDVAASLLQTVIDFDRGSAPPLFTEIAVKPISVREFVADWQAATGRRVRPVWGELPYRGKELFRVDQVHPNLPRFIARPREATYRDTLEA